MKTEIDTKIKNSHKPGYKLTKLGWIPEEWEVDSLSKVTILKRGKFTPRPRNDPKYYGGEIPFVQTGDVTNSRGRIKTYTQTLNKKGLGVSILFKKGTILITIAANIGYCAILEFDMACTDSLIGIECKEGIYNEFLNYYLGSQQQSMEYLAPAGAQKNINIEFLSPFKILIPPLPEQQKIDQILTTWDKAIEKTEQLIEAKTQLKKGLMQQLLTGKRRFKEFAGENWEEYVLGDLGKTFNGLSSKSKDDFGSGYPYIPYLNVINNSRVNPDQMDYVSVDSNEKQNAVKYGDIFFTTSSETPEEAGMPSVLLNELDTTYLNSFCFGFRFHNFDILSPAFARFYLRSYLVRKDIYRLAQGSTRYNISKKEVVKIKILLPSIEEQQKIASFLSNLEEELIVLNKRLLNFNEQKKGLMQKLLTGEVRVHPEK